MIISRPLFFTTQRAQTDQNHKGTITWPLDAWIHCFWLIDWLIICPYDPESTCPTGWVPFGNSCFLVIDIPTLDVNDAQRNCQKLGGDLPKITSTAENKFIHNLLNKQKKITRLGAWLGLYRKADKKFYWLDGTPLKGYSAWNTGEPNNVQSKEDCVHVYPSGVAKEKWNDSPCTLATTEISYAPVVLCQKYSN